jgi:hypothetical protein
MRSAVVSLLFLVACGGAAKVKPAELERPRALPGAAGGVWWDAGSSTLYVTDNTHHEIAAWTEQGGFTKVAKWPGRAAELGALVRLPDGRFVVAAPGAGAFVVAKDGKVTAIAKLDPARKRVGLALAPDGSVYVSYRGKDGAGGVARLDVDKGGETEVATQLENPIGIAVTADRLYVIDQDRPALLAYARAEGGQAVTVASSGLLDPDQLVAFAGGGFAVGSRTGTLFRVSKSGAVSEITRGLIQVRGMTYDPASNRLFLIQHKSSGPGQLRVVRL